MSICINHLIVYIVFCVYPTNAYYFIVRTQTEELLKQARADQVQHKKHFLAVQAARDRAEFDQVLQ